MLEPPEVAFVTEFRFSSAVWAEGVRILDEALEAGAKLALTSACCTFSVASVPPLNPPLKGRYDEDGIFKFARVLRERRLAQQQHPQIGRNGFEPATVDHARPVLLARS